jgi:adenylylsulfate kinase-like enzyme
MPFWKCIEREVKEMYKKGLEGKIRQGLVCRIQHEDPLDNELQ